MERKGSRAAKPHGNRLGRLEGELRQKLLELRS